ncbi:MAG: EF-hand domain-containing protein [Janthinobacterium lividum]
MHTNSLIAVALLLAASPTLSHTVLAQTASPRTTVSGSSAAIAHAAPTPAAQGNTPSASQTPTAGQSTDSTQTLDDKPANSLQGGYDHGQFDLDNDGMIGLAEAKSAAAYRFDKLDLDHDGTVSFKEIGQRADVSAFKKANADSDKTLDRAEYLKLVETQFSAADTDGDGKLDKAEMASPAGKKLLGLLK